MLPSRLHYNISLQHIKNIVQATLTSCGDKFLTPCTASEQIMVFMLWHL